MAGAAGTSTQAVALKRELAENPYAYEFYQALRLLDALHPELPPLGTGATGSPAMAAPVADGDYLTEADLREQEKANMLRVLQMTNWRVSGEGGAAELLGLKPSTLAYRMKNFGVEKG